MKCPYRCGVKIDYLYVGGNSPEDKKNTDNYIETAQHAVYEECYERECPYYTPYDCTCSRVEED